MCIPFLLLIALANYAYLLSRGKTVLYIVKVESKRAPKLVASPQPTALHSTGNISAEDRVHKNKVGHNSTRGIASPLLFIFPAEITAA